MHKAYEVTHIHMIQNRYVRVTNDEKEKHRSDYVWMRGGHEIIVFCNLSNENEKIVVVRLYVTQDRLSTEN